MDALRKLSKEALKGASSKLKSAKAAQNRLSSATLHLTTGPPISVKNRVVEIKPLAGTLHAAPEDVVSAVMGELKGRDVLRSAGDKQFRCASLPLTPPPACCHF